MANLVDKFGDAHKFLDVLSWKKLVQLIAFILIMGLTWATYENRDIIYGFASQKRIDSATPQVRELSKSTKTQIINVVEKSDLIVGMEIVLADFQKNQRIVVYTYMTSSQPQLMNMISNYTNSAIGPLPLFGDNIEDNKRLVSLINGEFICVPFESTQIQRLFPSSLQYIKYSCANGIPASYGRFTGVIIIELNRPPKPDEIDQIRIFAKTLSTVIYDNDLNK